jgi:hypothetical protein
MATPKIWYYPDGLNPYTGAPTVEEIDLLENVTRLEELFEVVKSDTESLSGRSYGAHWRTRLRLRLSLERFTSAALFRQLMTLQSYLNRGGTMAFALDSSKAFAGYGRQAFNRGALTLYTGGNTWNHQTSTPALVSGDEVWIQGDANEGVQELCTVTGHTVQDTLGVAGLTYTYQTQYPLVRWRDYWPALKLPPGEAPTIVTTDRRIGNTLDVELVEDVDLIRAFAPFDANALRNSGSGEQGVTPTDVQWGGTDSGTTPTVWIPGV